MIKLFKIFTVAIAFSVIFTSCSASWRRSTLYKEESIKSSSVNYNKVAILPNRLPISLKNPEYWRGYNWRIIKNNFTGKGVTVVDYQTSVNIFESSGLPVEDTKSSRDKYAEAAEKLGVDILVIPYYSNSYYVDNGFSTSENHYLSSGTFQFYSVKHNDFICRIDFEGDNHYTKTGMGYMIVGIGWMYLAPEAMMVWMGLGLLNDLIVTIPSPDNRWRTAFRLGVNSAINDFTRTYPPGKRSTYTAPKEKKLITIVSPKTENYSKYTIIELKQMKKQALQQEDYIKAGNINKEIEKKIKQQQQTNTNSNSDYEKYSVVELEAMKKQALQQEDYNKAGKISDVIKQKIKAEEEAKQKASEKVKAEEETKNNANVKSSNSKYGNYSIDELKQMKADAVKVRDFKKAGEIKKEIESR